MSVTFLGYYGQFNTGDDAFCVVSDWGARKFWNESNVKFAGSDLPIGYFGKTVKSTLFTTHQFKGQHHVESLFQPFIGKNVIYAGGSVFHREIDRFTREGIFSNYRKLGLLNLSAIGVSIGPFKNSRDRNSIRNYLSKFSFIALRDERSYEEVIDMNLSTTAVKAFDLAALLPSMYSIQPKQTSQPVLGVSACYYERYTCGDTKKEKARIDKLMGSIELVVKRIPNIRLKIFCFNAHPVFGDNEITDSLVAFFSDKNVDVERIEYNSSPESIWNEIQKCDAVLSTRLHSGIFSCFAEVPFIQIEYHYKCTDFLKDVGYDSRYTIGDFDISESEVALRIERIIVDKKSPSIKFMESCKDRALLNFTELKQFIK
ncbi:polysaccharide pyruvyl transferase family protein [Fulvivirga sediminis]|uniref:Polysaccharide pyruvyl transferase family protein n=1 Tax=Fulvivirga sediminis TaxID=2803949 RepID=A0A937JXP3_9BACT|nr:polysaccharide pyruvyl transferase family protein [Fulvivirga sediminis]MBL3654834.1 polysaccharide pyruvyl transferase family protein [Fulvivirga sediminis]